MKRLTAIASALVLLLSLAACRESSAATETAPVPPVAAAAKPSVEAAPEQAPLSAAYAEILKSGTYRYVLTVKTTTATQTVVSAAKGGSITFQRACRATASRCLCATARDMPSGN